MALLRARRPSVLWMQLPPVPLLWAVLWYRRTEDPALKVVADCHNATFGRRWGRVPFGLRLMNSCDLVMVHNEDVLERACGLGLDAQRLFVLEDVPPLHEASPPRPPPAFLADRPRPWILFPGSFASDEPVRELLQAARLSPAWTFVLTGRAGNAMRSGHDVDEPPPNVLLPGYLPTAEFDGLLRSSDVVLALTREDGIQLSACNEGLGFGKAMVVSDTPLLRRLFAEGALMADSSRPEALRSAIEQALTRRTALEAASRALAVRRRTRWRQRFEEGPEWLRPSR
jgi:glycosyltransferase involved in cell wall biosynthesis